MSFPLLAYDSCDKQAGRVSSLSLVRYRTNDYSVPGVYGYRGVLVRGYVDGVVISCGSEAIAKHLRSYERDDFVYDPINYLPFLDTFYGLLASLRGRLFRDADFAEFYCADNSRDSVPPSLLATALLLQSHDKVSDAEAKASAIS